MKISNLETKYETIEALNTDPTGRYLLGKPRITTLEKLKRELGYMYVYSIMDFDDSETTSVIYGEKVPVYPLFINSNWS